MKKIIALVILFAFVAFFESATAATCLDDQRIMRLSSSDNAHSAFWNQSGTGHDVEICYDDLFGSAYSGASPHTCVSLPTSNMLLSLSESSNAHASDTPDPVDYPEDVCYGDLTCSIKASCGLTETCVVTMSASDNAHLAECSFPGAYSLKVCCGTSEGEPVSATQSITGLSASNILVDEDTTVAVSLARPDQTDVTLKFYDAVTGILIHSEILSNVESLESLIYGPFDSEGVYKVVAEIPEVCRICAKTQTFSVTKQAQATTAIPETSLLAVIAVGILVVLFVSSRKR